MNTTNVITTTNLRIPTVDLIQYKMMAEEMGMSFNQYCNWVMQKASNIIQLGGDISDIRKKRKLDLRDLSDAMKKIKNKPMGANEDDKIIYGIED